MLTEGVAEAICYNLPECKARYSETEIMEAAERYLEMGEKRSNRKALFNVAKLYQEEINRLRRQIDILMGHDVQ